MNIIKKIKHIFKKESIIEEKKSKISNSFSHVVTEREQYESEKFYVISENGEKILCGITDKYVEGKENYSFYFYNQYDEDFYVKEVNLNNYFHSVYFFKKYRGNTDYEKVTKGFLTNEILIDMRIVDKVKIYVNGIDGLYIFETGKKNRFYPNEVLTTIKKDSTKFMTMRVDNLNVYYKSFNNDPQQLAEICDSSSNIYYDDDKLKRIEINREYDRLYKHYLHFDYSKKFNDNLNKKVSYMYSADESKAFYVVSKFVKDNGKDEIIKNEFDDDETINHIVEFDYTDTKSIIFMDHIIQNLKKASIYNIPVYDIINNSLHTVEYYNNLLRGKNDVNEEYEIACKKIMDLLISHNNDIESTIKYLCGKYVLSQGTGYIINANSPEEYQKIKNDNLKYYQEQYNNIAEYLILSNEYKPKWKSELSLFKLIKKHYQDAIYQYRNTELLGLQSFDIYIPSKKIAIEYQGKQHYEALDYFGGEKGLDKRRALDLKKKEICLKNGIKLIEWKYDEPITKVVLEKK
jgi:hypothetical protein